jgi:hypothetical protein
MLLLLMLLMFSVQMSLNAVQPQASDVVPTSGVLIRNSSEYRIKFWLRNQNSEWIPFELKPGYNSVYRNVDQIWIATEGQKAVHYSLEQKQRYRIFWNGTRWDVNLIAIRR